jgi:hypothetical protein
MEQNTAILLVISIVVVVFAWTFSRSRQILRSWAEKNHYQIISSGFRLLRRGPFFWTTSKNQVIYYVTVRTPDGMTRSGWLRCGSWWGGVIQNKAEVRWDE